MDELDEQPKSPVGIARYCMDNLEVTFHTALEACIVAHMDPKTTEGDRHLLRERSARFERFADEVANTFRITFATDPAELRKQVKWGQGLEQD